MARHIILVIEDDRFARERDEAKIAQEAALDGIHVIRTDVPVTELAAEQTVQARKILSRVAAGFRCFKTVDLKGRPINHRLAEGFGPNARRARTKPRTDYRCTASRACRATWRPVTLCKNRVKAELPSPVSFQPYPTATPLKLRAFELLEVTIDL